MFTAWFPAKERHATDSPLATSSAAHRGSTPPGRGATAAAGDGRGAAVDAPPVQQVSLPAAGRPAAEV